MLLSSRNQLQQCVSFNDEKQYVVKYKELELSSAYQPIFDKSNQPIGVEALVRITTTNQESIRPDLFFNSVEVSVEDKINVDRLSRIIHIRNFAQSHLRKLKLFLNILPSAGEFYAFDDTRINLLSKRLTELNLSSTQLVMEVVELDAPNGRCLQQAMHKLSENGFQIAVDDFGMHASNRKRVALLKPDIIKIDRSLLLAYMDGMRNELLNGIELAREIGAKIVVEGIETQQQYQSMRQLDVDFYQGYYLAVPTPLKTVKTNPVPLP